MRARRLRVLAVAIALAWPAGCDRRLAAPVHSIDIEVRVHPDGALDVRETIVIEVPGGVGVAVVRRVPDQRAESVRFRAAAANGRMLEAGKDSSPALAIDGRRGLEVTWTFPASFPAGRATLDWSYQATGTLAVRGARGRLEQVVLPSDRMFQPAVSRIRVVVPLGMHVFDGTGIAEAGWTVSRTADGIVAERSNAPGGEAATIVAELGVDPARLIEPTWQRYADWAADLVPAFVAGGLFILVIGAGVLWIIRFQYPRRTASDADREERAAVRRGLRATGVVAVALAAVLAGVTWATLSHFGPWSQAVPLSVFVVGVVFLSVAERIV